LETRIEKQRLAELGADSVKEELEAMKAEHERVLAAHEVAIKALRDDCDETLAKAEEERNALVAEVIHLIHSICPLRLHPKLIFVQRDVLFANCQN